MIRQWPRTVVKQIFLLGACLIFSPTLIFAQIPFPDSVEINVETENYVAGEPAVFSGESLELHVDNSSPNFIYQWFKDGVAIPNATDPTLSLNNVTWDDMLAVYTCHVEDPATSGVSVYEAPIQSYVRDAVGGVYSAQCFIAQKGDTPQLEWDKLKEDLDVEVIDECMCDFELWKIPGSRIFDFDNSTVTLLSIEQTVGHAKSRIEGADLLYAFSSESFDLEAMAAKLADQPADAQSEQVGGLNRRVKVAVLDAGIDNEHPALVNYQWENSHENPTDNIDNDCNCTIDDYNGYDFVNDSSGPIEDAIGHGTHVAGIITSMLPQNANLEIMDVKIIDDKGYGNVFDAICGIHYAVKADADIINASWGYTGPPISLMEDAIRYARRRGVLFVASAGNAGDDVDELPHYPSSTPYDNVISVTAIDNCDRLQGNFSASGQGVDLAAYGYNIYSTLPGGFYGRASGTSMATPAVSGFLAAAYNRGYYCSYYSLKYHLLNNIVAIPALQGLVGTQGKLNLENNTYIDLDIKLQLGGALADNQGVYQNEMRTDLDEQQLIYGLYAQGVDMEYKQPYFATPWEYRGTEGLWAYVKYDGSCADDSGVDTGPTVPDPIVIPSNPIAEPFTDQEILDQGLTIADPIAFPIDIPLPDPILIPLGSARIVDWVLVSFRENTSPSSEFRRVAAHLLDDGSLHFLEPRVLTIQMPQQFYIVVEHRNHLPVMTPQPVTVVNGVLSYDFTLENSYAVNASGQKEHQPGVFSMIPGDINNDYDVSGLDYNVMLGNFGDMDEYQSSDLNLDGNVDHTDEILHKDNDGKHSSVPR